MYTEEKAKVVAAVLWTECIQFLAALAILHQDDMKRSMNCTRMNCARMNSSFSSNRHGAKFGKDLKQFCPPKISNDLCLLFCINPSSMLQSIYLVTLPLREKYIVGRGISRTIGNILTIVRQILDSHTQYV